MVLVVGDSMLDRYWEGTVERISPEAPVPVLQVRREYCRPGGAANVAANLHALGSQTTLITPLGADPAGQTLHGLLEGIRVIPVKAKRTQEKIRLVASRQQLLRADYDEPEDADLIAEYVKHSPSIVVLSDYAKGALAQCQALIAQTKAKVLIDPKGDDFTKYRGAYLLKPNEAELRAVVGPWKNEAEFRDKCAALKHSLDLECLLVTRGERGMALLTSAFFELPAETREVYDLSGAGDTVIATLAHFLSKGSDILDAARMANKAAGLVVGKFGTATVTMDELRASC